MPVSSLIVGVDLDKIKPIRGCKTLVGDITTAATAAALKRASGGAAFDAVLHDGAPNVGGAWSAEAYGQSALVLDAAKLAVAMLAPGGTFVTKVFRSKDYTALLYAFRQLFDRVDATKPAASRSTAAPEHRCSAAPPQAPWRWRWAARPSWPPHPPGPGLTAAMPRTLPRCRARSPPPGSPAGPTRCCSPAPARSSRPRPPAMRSTASPPMPRPRLMPKPGSASIRRRPTF